MEKINGRGVLYTYDGTVAFPNGTHTLRNIAVGLSREGRYCGQGLRFWPVALHTFIVCDLLNEHPEMQFDALLHDSPEYIMGDTPKPKKTDETERMEEELLVDIYKSFKITFPEPEIRRMIKLADKSTLRGEVYTVGTQALQEVYDRDPNAEGYVHYYLDKYDYDDYLDAGGKVPVEFMRRFRQYKDQLPPERLVA